MPLFSLGSKLRMLIRKTGVSGEFYDELEDLLIESDIGVNTALELISEVKKRGSVLKDEQNVLSALYDILSKYVFSADMKLSSDKLNVFLVLGVNGVGKTTTIAKLASFYLNNYGTESVLAAGDTFRAAAIDQIVYHGDRLKMRVVRQNPGSDPGAVIYDAIENASASGKKLVIADTAGRMHNKANLVRELQKIDKIISGKTDSGNYKKIIIIDATTGQNGLRQAELFHEAVDLDAVILTKYDSMSKGGIVVPICRDLNIPIAFVGTGEKYEDIELFDKDKYLKNLLDIT